MKTLILYYSSTGNNYEIAKWSRESAEKEGSEVRLRKVNELAPDWAIEQNPSWKEHLQKTKDIQTASLDDLDWADVYVFCIPTRYGNVPAQMKQFMDSTGPLWQKGKLVNKIVTGMTSAMNPHGGQESTLLSLYTTIYHWGAIVVAPGYTDESLFAAGGNPYGVSVSVDMNGKMQADEENVRKAVFFQVKRALEVAQKVHS